MRRRVLITGAGSGIGLSTCLELTRLGFDCIGLVRTEEEADTLRRTAQLQAATVDILVVDLADPARRRDIATELDLWAVVNNAGYMGAGEILDVGLEEARRQLEVMLLAPVDLIRQAVPAMARRGHGRIVNVSTSASQSATPLTGWYTATKAALRQVSDTLRLELAPLGVGVIDVEPGGIRTNIWNRAASELVDRSPGPKRRKPYDRVLRRLDSAQQAMADPGDVATRIGEALTAGKPPRHVRVGPGAGLLRSADSFVPDVIWDRVVSTVAGTR